MLEYEVEITDTFGGEANYCWVRNYTVTSSSIRGAVAKAGKLFGVSGWRKAYGDEWESTYRRSGMILFCTEKEAEDLQE